MMSPLLPVLLFTVLTAPLCLANAPGMPCELPSEWRGEWFQSDRAHLGPVVISKHNFTSSGTCIENGKNHRYLIKEETVTKDEKFSCYKCIVISMKHRNVIQYKESYCDLVNQDLESLCRKITGDAMLYSMFRLSAAPHSCPFRGPLTFTYSRNLQECVYPVSQVDSCADDSRLLLRFQACADVPSSESYEEELVCLGSWQEGANHYLVGKINHTHANSDNDRYRCFIYESAPHPDNPDLSTMYLAQSPDATCQGLISAYEGSKTMKLTRANQGGKKCKLPNWLTAHNHWHTLDYTQSYLVYHKNTSLRISNGTSAPTDPEVRGHTDLRLVCHEYSSDSRHRQHKPTRHRSGDWTSSNTVSNTQWRAPDSSEGGSARDRAGDRQWSHDGVGTDTSDGDVTHDSASGRWGGSKGTGEGAAGRGGGGHMTNHDNDEGRADRAEAVQHKRGHHNRHSVTVIVHVTVGCRTGYWCMRINRRADHVVQVQTGDLAYRAEEACTSHYWNPGNIVATTLVARGEQRRSCGPLGRYMVATPAAECSSSLPSYSRINVGCTAHDTLELQTSCPTADVTSYQCHGRWESDGVTYVVASPNSRPSGAPRRVCFAYSARGVGEEGIDGDNRAPPTVTLTARHDTCSPTTQNAHLTLNATLTGPCAEASSIASDTGGLEYNHLSLLATTLATLLISCTCNHSAFRRSSFSSLSS